LAANGCLVPGAPGVVGLVLLLEKSEDTNLRHEEWRRTKNEEKKKNCMHGESRTMLHVYIISDQIQEMNEWIGARGAAI
jgi:hypothetical protein